MNLLVSKLHKSLSALDIEYDIETRVKSNARVVEKLKHKGYINDLVGARVIYKGKGDVGYHVVKSLVQEFNMYDITDYTMIPKKNNYQSIHLNGDFLDYPMEIQIRNKYMDYVAKKGTARIR